MNSSSSSSLRGQEFKVSIPCIDPAKPDSSFSKTYSSYVVRVHTRHGIKTLSFETLAIFFTLTAKKAAEDLGISSRTLIRVCRSLGIRRWPYLGFRSEQKNVDRIRQEAIRNLQFKLEKEAGNSSRVVSSETSTPRRASAKRLLQLKLPQAPVSTLPQTPLLHISVNQLSSWCHHTNPQSFSAGPPLLTPTNMTHPSCLTMSLPPPTSTLFQGTSISPRKPEDKMEESSSCVCEPSVSTRKTIPSFNLLNLLVDASILCSTRTPPVHTVQKNSMSSKRTMSMRDILSSTSPKPLGVFNNSSSQHILSRSLGVMNYS